MRGQRVLVPKVLQPAILKELHHTHLGIVKMKALARSTVYWKNIDSDIEKLVKNCTDCAKVQKEPAKTLPHHWEQPSETWQRIHLDFAGPILGKQLLIVVDALSKWCEIVIFNHAPTAATTKAALRKIFSAQGLPYQIVSDNATIFSCEEMQNFAKENGIDWSFSAPGHPATNGQAERMVQIIKYKIKAMQISAANFEETIDAILFKYRITPLNNGKSPAELHYGRKLRSALLMLKPAPKSHRTTQPSSTIRELKTGDRVLSRHYRGPNKWVTGVVLQRLGRLHYLIKLDNGFQYKRHIDQLKLGPESPAPDHVEIEENPHGPVIRLNLATRQRSQALASEFAVPTAPTRQPTPAYSPSRQLMSDQPVTSQAEMPSHGVPLRRSSRTRKPVKRLDL